MTRVSDDRTHRPLPAELDPAQLALYRAITGGPRGAGPQAFPLAEPDGRLRGPFSAMLLDPALGGPLQELGAALRFAGSLPARARELVILTVAAEVHSGFEQRAHEALGRRIGLTEDELAAVRAGAPLPGPDPVERAAVAAARTLARRAGFDDAAYRAAVEVLSERDLFEVVVLVGYYGALAGVLAVFAPEQDAPE